MFGTSLLTLLTKIAFTILLNAIYIYSITDASIEYCYKSDKFMEWLE